MNPLSVSLGGLILNSKSSVLGVLPLNERDRGFINPGLILSKCTIPDMPNDVKINQVYSNKSMGLVHLIICLHEFHIFFRHMKGNIPFMNDLAAHRQDYRDTILHMGNGWVTL